MTNKKKLQFEMSEMKSVINHFNKGNQVVINRWVNQFGYTYDMIVIEFNTMVDTYNTKYGKRFGMVNTL